MRLWFVRAMSPWLIADGIPHRLDDPVLYNVAHKDEVLLVKYVVLFCLADSRVASQLSILLLINYYMLSRI
jgi:hypothetical protein